MKIWSMVSQKGGASKSTSLINIAAALAQQGKQVLVFDADEQPTATKWGSSRNRLHPDVPKILFDQAYGKIADDLLERNQTNEYVLVDTAGHASTEMRSAFLVSDIVLIPFRVSMADLDSLPFMENLVRLAREMNPELKAYAFLSCAPTDASAKDVKPAREAILEYPELTLLDTIIYHRQCYIDSIATGLGVTEIKPKSPSIRKAQEETNSLVKEILNGKHK